MLRYGPILIVASVTSCVNARETKTSIKDLAILPIDGANVKIVLHYRVVA